MPSHSWLKGQELTEEERQMQLQNESADRAVKRKRIARVLAREYHKGNDDIDIAYVDVPVEFVDGGYWVEARVWVDADAVEERLDSQD